MKEETSIHWHGLVLPNFYDGVPYLTPPIKPGQTLKYEFLSINLELIGIIPIPCYKSKAVYGSIVIHPKNVGV
jgi:hypothetical protein